MEEEWKTKLSTPYLDSNFDLPVIGSLVYWASDHAATEASTAEDGKIEVRISNVMQAQTSSRTSTSYPDLMQRHVDGDGIPHYLKSNYHPISPTVSGNNSCYHPHQQYQQQPLRRSFGHPGSIQATMRDSYINHHSTTNHNEMQWTSSYYGNTSTSQGNGRDGNKGRKEKKERGEGKDRSTKERRKSSSALSS
uniref:(California timema) hypothetical protein n=1 Tax=Timema californicum TaxID=61474 RepID=A0A7R9P534_TIMCA|nr:unnamed protein product [Timema californicum]